MARGILVIVVLLAAGTTLAVLFGKYLIGKWGAPQDTEWRPRLDRLHELLVQVLASDSTLSRFTGLPLDIAEQLGNYFGPRLAKPDVPDDKVIDRVILLEEWLVEIHKANNTPGVPSPLPPKLSGQIAEYLRERARRLEP